MMREFVGYLSVAIPELHHVEVPRLAEALDRFLAMKTLQATAITNSNDVGADIPGGGAC
jgi:hypothetical protein